MIFIMWGYNVIRGYNEFLLNMKNSTLDENLKNRRMAECRFLRALHYFNLAMRLGGVPIITEPQQIGDEDIYPSRNTEKEVYEFVRKELDEIIDIYLLLMTQRIRDVSVALLHWL